MKGWHKERGAYFLRILVIKPPPGLEMSTFRISTSFFCHGSTDKVESPVGDRRESEGRAGLRVGVTFGVSRHWNSPHVPSSMASESRSTSTAVLSTRSSGERSWLQFIQPSFLWNYIPYAVCFPDVCYRWCSWNTRFLEWQRRRTFLSYCRAQQTINERFVCSGPQALLDGKKRGRSVEMFAKLVQRCGWIQ